MRIEKKGRIENHNLEGGTRTESKKAYGMTHNNSFRKHMGSRLPCPIRSLRITITLLI